MMAAALADGVTVLENAALEPEVEDLAVLLNKMGADINGAGTPTIRVRGVSKLEGAEHSIIPDRIEAGTFLAAAAITGGHVILDCVEPRHLTAVMAKLSEAGVDIRVTAPRRAAREVQSIGVQRSAPARAADVTTQEYPGFPTDMQAQYMALATQAQGPSVITETIFENRFLHALELARMGADIAVDGRRAVVRGPTKLSGASVQASDLRASASLVLAALAAEDKLRQLGARIQRISEA
jgi:UDP-N-acetylglucosamine 1-carboxyvinyltransferase